jgi:polysaccharide pyruvyl transferase WcaK-like protein
MNLKFDRSHKNIAFFYVAETQHQNLGDVVINRNLVQLAGEFGQVHIFEGKMPRAFLNAIGADNHKCFSSIIDFSFFIISMGIQRLLPWKHLKLYFLLNPGGFSGGLTLLGFGRQICILVLYAVLKILGIRIVRLGASMGPFSPMRAKIERLKALFIHTNSVRDSISLTYMRSIGIDRIQHFPDLAFLLLPNNSSPATSRTTNDSQYVAFSFRRYPKSANCDDRTYLTIEKVAQTLQQNTPTQYLFTSQVEFDVDWNANLAARLSSKGYTSNVVSSRSEQSLMSVYRECVSVFSNRLHVLLFAMRQGALAFAVIDTTLNQKILGIYSDLGLQDFIVDINCEQPLLLNSHNRDPSFLHEIFNEQRQTLINRFETLVELD